MVWYCAFCRQHDEPPGAGRRYGGRITLTDENITACSHLLRGTFPDAGHEIAQLMPGGYLCMECFPEGTRSQVPRAVNNKRSGGTMRHE